MPCPRALSAAWGHTWEGGAEDRGLWETGSPEVTKLAHLDMDISQNGGTPIAGWLTTETLFEKDETTAMIPFAGGTGSFVIASMAISGGTVPYKVCVFFFIFFVGGVSLKYKISSCTMRKIYGIYGWYINPLTYGRWYINPAPVESSRFDGSAHYNPMI